MNLSIANDLNILTGDRPTGPLHLGHYAGSLKKRLELQTNYQNNKNQFFDELYNRKSFKDLTENESNSTKENEINSTKKVNFYILVADTQGLTDNFDQKDKIRKNVIEIVKDYLAIGLDPNLWCIFLQSQIVELFELATYFANIITFNILTRVPTLKAEIQQKGMENNLPMGFLNYPISQAADLLLFNSNFAPVGKDQISLIEFANEIVHKYGLLYSRDRFQKVESLLTNSPTISGIDGKAKASKSLNNCIYLKDDSQIVTEKVHQMYTDPDHIRIDDPGKVDGNVVFHYLDSFYSDTHHLQELKNHYMKGGLGDRMLKNLLTKELNNFLEPIRQKRQTITDDHALEVLRHGSNMAKIVAKEKIQQIRDDLGLFRL